MAWTEVERSIIIEIGSDVKRIEGILTGNGGRDGLCEEVHKNTAKLKILLGAVIVIGALTLALWVWHAETGEVMTLIHLILGAGI